MPHDTLGVMGFKLAVLFLAPLAVFAQSPCNNTPAYTPCEMDFDLTEQAAAAHPNPYATVELKIEFRSPKFRTLAMPGFWNGGRRMVVRFSPTEAGEWQYHVTSNIADWNDRQGSFTAAASDAPGFVRTAEVHHWAYTERNLPHLWMGASEPLLGSMNDNAFRAMADARAGEKFNHLRGLVTGEALDAAYDSADAPRLAYFQRLDERVRYLSQKGIAADLVLASHPAFLTKLFPGADQRRRFVRYLAARYAPMNVTWQGVEEWENDPDGRILLKEIGGYLKEADPYEHPRTSGARVTSSSLLDDGWMNFVDHGSGSDDSVGAIEHQLYAVPFVNTDVGRGAADPAAFRRRLWNATMNGEYPTLRGSGAADAKAMTAWFEFFSGTRHWELEPYFDVDGGRALALEDTDYIAYVEKPGPVEVIVEKHAYEVSWMNPADGETVKQKKQFNGDHFTGEPPDKSHDWVLRLVRPGRIESMNKSYYFESRSSEEGSRALPVTIQEIETNPDKVPFQIEQPAGDLSISKATPYSAKITRQTRATGSMMWLWTGDVTSDRQGFRVLGTGQKGEMRPAESVARSLPATILLRIYGMNANGKVYELNKACQLTR